MTKREEWKTYELDSREVVDAEGNRIAEAYGGANPEYAERVRNAHRIAAVPDYEAAILSDMGKTPNGELHDGICSVWVNPTAQCSRVCEMKRAALRKGGVIP